MDTISLRWVPSEGAEAYCVQYYSKTAWLASWTTAAAFNADTRLTVFGLEPGTPYGWRVCAVGPGGVQGAFSSEVEAATAVTTTSASDHQAVTGEGGTDCVSPSTKPAATGSA
jgi:hypothetical protein